MLPGIAEPIIQGETNPIRFEKFCTELLEASEGKTLVPTSVVYDRGRDARSLAPSRGSHDSIVCVTLNRDIDGKVESDLDRVSSTSNPDRLIYCCSQKLTELKIDEITSSIRNHLALECSILVLGAEQLAHLAGVHSTILEKHYPGEIRTLEDAFYAFQKGRETTETKGLRLALIAFGSDDATSLREAVSSRVVLDTLRTLNDASSLEVGEKLSSDLRLPKRVDSKYVERILRQLEGRGLAREAGGHWRLTEEGQTESTALPSEAARDLLAGRTIIRKRIESLTGISFTDSQFERFWSTLLDFLSELFYSNGLTIIQAVNNLLSTEANGTYVASDLEGLLAQGARRLKGLFSGPDIPEEIEQGILDIFTERSGPAFDWLAHVCERFVALCALGLEATSAEEIRQILRRQQIVLDSDIILTALCEGEPDHGAARDLIARWRELGGKILLSSTVLEEVAHHAWISENHFKETSYLVGRVRADESRRYAENAFVRAFLFIERDSKQADRRWRVYIGQFRGLKSNDYSNILALLQTEMGAELLPSEGDAKVKKSIANYVCESVAKARHITVEQLQKPECGKAERDGEVLASIAAAREILRRRGSDSTMTLLSSSSRLRQADRKFRTQLGAPEAVMSLAAFSYLLSLLPDVSLGASSLRRALFEFGEAAHLTDTQRMALRVIRGTGEFDLPWARRRTLSRHLESALLKEAKKRDVSVRSVRREFSVGDPAIRPAQIIVDSLREMALSDSKLHEARREVSVLQAEVEGLRKELAKSRQPIRKKPRSRKAKTS
jgi:hypothetical protein